MAVEPLGACGGAGVRMQECPAPGGTERRGHGPAPTMLSPKEKALLGTPLFPRQACGNRG